MAGPPETAATRSASSAPSEPAERAGAGNPAEPPSSPCADRSARSRSARIRTPAAGPTRRCAGRRRPRWPPAPLRAMNHSPTNSSAADDERGRHQHRWRDAAAAGASGRRPAESSTPTSPMSIVGSAVTSSEVRNSASRVALPPTKLGGQRRRRRASSWSSSGRSVSCGELSFVGGTGRSGRPASC